jgi:hypothetical protein
MSTTVHTLEFAWARAHRSALVIALLAVALAVTAGVFVLGLATDSPHVARTSVSTGHYLQPNDNGCQQDMPGVRGVLKAC